MNATTRAIAATVPAQPRMRIRTLLRQSQIAASAVAATQNSVLISVFKETERPITDIALHPVKSEWVRLIEPTINLWPGDAFENRYRGNDRQTRDQGREQSHASILSAEIYAAQKPRRPPRGR